MVGDEKNQKEELEQTSKIQQETVIIDGEKVEKKRKEKLEKASKNEAKNYAQIKIAEAMGVSESTYRKIVNGNNTSALDKHIGNFVKLANKLDISLIELIKDDYKFKDKFFHIQLKDLKNEDAFNSYLYNLEEQYGRFTVFNTFPSSIYYRDKVPNSRKRYELISNFNHEKTLSNREYYPINEVLSFGFNFCNRFTKNEKISILNKMINIFFRDKNANGNENKHLKIFNPETINYYHDSPTSSVFVEINTVLIPSPTNKYELCIIESQEVTKDIREYLNHKPQMLGTQDSVKILKALKDCLEQDGEIITFINNLANLESKLVPSVTNSLSSDFQDLKDQWNYHSDD